MAEHQTAKAAGDYFRDWEGHAFGFGYGTGEPVIIPVVKDFLAAFGIDESSRGYDYTVLEGAVGGPAAWLLINRLCQLNVIEYGTSPRFGRLTTRGERLRDYFASKTVDELLEDLVEPENYHGCYPDHCNCDGPAKCVNPFWTDAPLPAPPAAIEE
jgi:hypothetical protein